MNLFGKLAKRIRIGRRGDRHRRQRMVTRGLFSFAADRIGNELYYIGATSEKMHKRARRALKRGAKAAWRGLKSAAAAVASFFTVGLREILADMVNPFRKMWRSVKSFISVMKEMKGAPFSAKWYRIKAFMRYGWLWNKHLVGRFASHVLPVICAAVCVVTVHSVLSLNYVVAVSYNGSDLGYVEDESVYDSAVKLIDNRIVNVEGSYWKPSAILTISVAGDEQLSDEEALAGSILNSSGSEIVEATGLYVGGQFLGATTAGEMLSAKLESVLEPYREQAEKLGPNVNVRFSRNVTMEEGIYPSSSIVAYDDICDIIDSDEEEDIYYDGKEGESVSEIASANGLTVEKLKALNPDAELNGSVLDGDVRLLVAKEQQIFSVKTVGTITTVTKIGFESKVTKDPRYNLGYYYMVTKGSEGELTTVTEVEYHNGKEVSREVVSQTVTKEPVDQEIIVGVGGSSGSSTGTGVFCWPTGPYQFISSYFGWRVLRGQPNCHTGLDIAAAYGTAIYAADNGTVKLAAYTNTGYGYYIMLDHHNGIVTIYGHCSALLVETGDVVARGQTIALVGSTGNSTGNHLHFEVRVNGTAVDPTIYLYP